MAWQHDVRWQPDHSLTIFDDGALPQVHSQSRVIRERIDWKRRRVVLVGRYAHTPAIVAGSQGDYQVLSDGNSFVGWGEAPYITEFGAGGQQLFDARLPPGGQTYRAFRASWRGQPSTPPAIAVASSAGRAVAYVSWNGATEVRSWRVLGGERPDAGEPVGSGPRTGFETPIPVSGVHAWYAAEALGDDGQILGISAAVQP
jgi:hypothetical protein